MATLTYDLAVVGRRVVESELASLERRFAQHSATLNKISSKAKSDAARASKTTLKDGPMQGPGHKEYLASMAKRHQAELAGQRKVAAARVRQEREVARAAEKEAKGTANAKAALDRQRSAALFQQHKEESRRAREIQERRAQFIKSTVGNGAGRVVRGIAAVGSAGIAAAGIGGGALAAASISQALRLDEASRRLAIAGRGPGEAGVDPERMRKSFVRMGIETGIDPEQIAGGTAKFVAKTGDLATATANMRNFAVTAQATGASIEDIASAGADLSEKFGIKSTKDMGEALAVLAVQGKRGAFELKDMAEQFPEMAAAAQRAGMKGVGGMRTLGGLAQIARRSTGSGSEASTALQMMLTQLVTKSDKLKSGEALGGAKVDVFEGGDPTKNARDIPTVLAEIVSRAQGDKQKLAKLFDIRGTRAMSPLIQEYQRAAEGTDGTKAQKQEAGRKAVLKYIADASSGSGDWKEVERDAKDAMASFSVQINIAKQMLEDALQSQLMPAIIRLIPSLSQLVPVVAEVVRVLVGLASFLASNPLMGLGAALAMSISYEIGKAQIGQLFEAAMRKSLGLPPVPGGPGSGAGPGAPGTSGGTKSNIFGAATTGLSLGMSVATMIVTAQVVNFEKGEMDMSEGGKLLSRQTELLEQSKKGPLTPEEQKEVRENQLKLNKMSTSAAKPSVTQTVLATAMDAVSTPDFIADAFGMPRTNNMPAAQNLTDPNHKVVENTLGTFAKQSEAMVAAIEANTAAQLKAAAAGGPNRGDAPAGDIKNKK